MKTYLYQGVAVAALLLPAAALAQSTGSIDFEERAIVVTGTKTQEVGGVVAPDTSKAKAVLTQEFIQRQTAGQTINEIINQLPGVSFQNNDPYGSAGGKMYIRGFDNTRISQTVDGIPLNDSGGYALYSSQQLDSELIEQVNVNLGTTDVDSPTAAASGSTVNYRSRNPHDDFGARLSGSAGDYKFFRIFGVVDTGVFTPWGTKAFLSASHSENDNVFNNYGKIDKDQYNAKIYQPIGDNGDFISIAGHYNESRNNFFGSVPLRTDSSSEVPNRFPLTKDERFYDVESCQVTGGVAGAADAANNCGSVYDMRVNPSNTGNIRVSSRFTLADDLILTVDPSYQYVKANGGGTLKASEGVSSTGYPGFIQASSSAVNYYAGRDLNGDGDTLDTVRLHSPSQTQTNRFGLIASLRYDISEAHSVRLAYSWDHAKHRQTGEAGYLLSNGAAADVFPVDDPILDSDGNALQKRNRKSYAILNQVSGEYRGQFLDDSLTVNLGLRMPFFKRELNNYCFTTAATGTLACFNSDEANEAYAAANPTVQGPQQREYKYDKALPNVGLVFDLTPKLGLFANYSKGMQVPGTDNLYNSFYFAEDAEQAQPKAETTDNIDVGFRYRSGKIQAQFSGWYTKYQNRLASAYDPDLDRTVYRNLGDVDKYGVDGSISYQPVPELVFYAFGSYLKSKIKENVQTGGGAGYDCSDADPTNTTDVRNCAFTKGKRESGAPKYTFGGRIQGTLGPVELGIQVKRTGSRYVNDQNLPVTSNGAQVYGAKVPAYTLVDLDARVNMSWAGLNDKTYLQLNVTNLFDKLYVGSFDGGLASNSVPYVQIGSPRAVSGTLVVEF